MRLIALLAVVYLLYRALKTWAAGRSRPSLGRRSEAGVGMTPVDDIMVQDPQCRVYFPKREGFPLNHEGLTLFFCSAGCRDRFLDAQSHRQPPADGRISP